MVGRERQREEFNRLRETHNSGSSRTRLCWIALDYVGALCLQVGRLIGEGSAHLDVNTIKKRAPLPGIVKGAQLNLLSGLKAAVADLEWTAPDPLSVVTGKADGVVRFGQLIKDIRDGHVGLNQQLIP